MSVHNKFEDGQEKCPGLDDFSFPSATRFSGFMNAILDRFPGVLGDLFGIPQHLLRPTGNLFLQALCLLLLVPNNFPGLFLNLAGNIFDGALDLIFVHDGFFQKINRLLCV